MMRPNKVWVIVWLGAWLCFVPNLASSRTFRFFKVWFKRPYAGPQCVVDVVGADLRVRANKNLDFWSKPDVKVEVRHKKEYRATHIEPNTFRPRFLFSSKMPFYRGKGFCFTVYDVNVLEKNDVIGRIFVNASRVRKAMEDEAPMLMSLGEGIGTLKVRFSCPKGLNATRALDAS